MEGGRRRARRRPRFDRLNGQAGVDSCVNGEVLLSCESTADASQPVATAARAAQERTRRFRRLRNWRVGIEARISHLKRSFGLRRTRMRRLAGARTWVGLGILAYILQRMTVVAAR
jgi:Transposase DDE domain